MKKTIIFIIIAIIILAIVTVFLVFQFKDVYKDEFQLPYFEKKVLPLPGRCKNIPTDAMCIVIFKTDKSVENVLSFYDDYVNDLKRVKTSTEPGIIGYLVEDMDFVIIKYSANRNEDENITYFRIEYEPLSYSWEPVNP